MVVLAALALLPVPAATAVGAESNTVLVTDAAYDRRDGKRVWGYRTPTYTLAPGDASEFRASDSASAGYAWGRFVVQPKRVLSAPTVTDLPVPPPTTPPTVSGSSPIAIRLNALKPGRATVEMSYVGPGRRPPVADHVRFDVVVRPGTR